MESAIKFGLDDWPVVESDEDDDVIPDGFEEAIRDEGGWVDINAIDTTPLTPKEIHDFFVQRRLRKEQVTASKPFERGYRLFYANKVQGISLHRVTSDSVYCIIRATVLPSQKHMGPTRQQLRYILAQEEYGMRGVIALQVDHHDVITPQP